MLYLKEQKSFIVNSLFIFYLNYKLKEAIKYKYLYLFTTEYNKQICEELLRMNRTLTFKLDIYYSSSNTRFRPLLDENYIGDTIAKY